MPSRIVAALATFAATAAAAAALLVLDARPAAAQWRSGSEDTADVALEWGVEVPLRDGATALVTLYRPADQREPLPVILTMTPYGADKFHETAMYFARRGYVYALADTRGRGNTGGDWLPFVQDGPTGYDLVEWLARQSWSDGQVTMSGLSYDGFTQWTTLKEFPPHLATIVPTAPGYFSYTSLHPYNIFATYAIRWLTAVSGRLPNRNLMLDASFWNRKLWSWYAANLPYAALDSVAGNTSTELQTWIRHPDLDDYIDDTAVAIEDYPRIDLPILSVTGHYDSEQRATFRHYLRHMEHGSPAGRAKHFLVIGPWDHLATYHPRLQIGGLRFDPASDPDMGRLHREWYDWTLKDGSRPTFLRNRVGYYLPGAEEWRWADELAGVTAGTRLLRLASPAGNPANLAAAGALLEGAPPADDPPDTWTSDPLDTRPGELELRTPPGYVAPADRLELFGAGLVYETAPLDAPLDLAGFARLRLWLEMDVPDTDFQARLHEVTADGRAIFLTRQLMRARYRKSLRRQKLVTPGEPTEFVLDDFDFFARRIAAGSRIRLTVGALNSIYYEKNYNSGGVVAFESGDDARTAHVRLFHDPRRGSTLELPLAAPSDTAMDVAPGGGLSAASRRPPAPR